MSNAQLVAALRRFGFIVKTLHPAAWKDLRRYNTAGHVLLVSWMLHGYIGHFSLVERVTRNGITLADPSVDHLVSLRKQVFLRLWLDYDGLWYPRRPRDIQLRWLAVVAPRRPHPIRRRAFAERRRAA